MLMFSTIFQVVDLCGGKLVNLFILTASYRPKERVVAATVGEVVGGVCW